MCVSSLITIERIPLKLIVLASSLTPALGFAWWFGQLWIDMTETFCILQLLCSIRSGKYGSNGVYVQQNQKQNFQALLFRICREYFFSNSISKFTVMCCAICSLNIANNRYKWGMKVIYIRNSNALGIV